MLEHLMYRNEKIDDKTSVIFCFISSQLAINYLLVFSPPLMDFHGLQVRHGVNCFCVVKSCTKYT